MDEHVRRPKRVLALQGKKVISISTGTYCKEKIWTDVVQLICFINVIQGLSTVLYALIKGRSLRGETTTKANLVMELQLEFTSLDL